MGTARLRRGRFLPALLGSMWRVWPVCGAMVVLLVLGASTEANNPLMAVDGDNHDARHVSDQRTPQQTNPLIDGEQNKPEEASVDKPEEASVDKPEEASVDKPEEASVKDPSFYGLREKDAKQIEDQAPASPPTKAQIAKRRAYNKEMRGMQLVVSLDHAVERAAAEISGDATEAMRPLTLGESDGVRRLPANIKKQQRSVDAILNELKRRTELGERRNPLASEYPGDAQEEKAAEHRKIEKAGQQVHELAARFDLASMESKARKAAIGAEREAQRLARNGADEHGADILRKAGALSEQEQDKADKQTKSIVRHARRFDKATDTATATRELGSMANQAGLLAEGEMNTVDKVAESEADLSNTD